MKISYRKQRSLLSRNAALVQLFKDLRWEVETVPLPGLERLQVVTFRIPVTSFRPADDLLLTAVRLSGVPSFIELIDTAALPQMADPLLAQIEALLPQPSE